MNRVNPTEPSPEVQAGGCQRADVRGQKSEVGAGDDLRAWRTLAGRMFADLGRARITPRQALVMEILVRVTLSVGRQSVRIPRLEMFAAFGLSSGNVSEAINGFKTPVGKPVPGLVNLGLVSVVESHAGGSVFTILPDATQWRCCWRYPREASAVFLRDVNAVANQVTPDLCGLAPEPGLSEAMARTNLENAGRSYCRNEPEPLKAGGRSYCRNVAPSNPVVTGAPVQRSETFNRFSSERLNVDSVLPGAPVVVQENAKFSQPSPNAPQPGSHEECEIFATLLRARVRGFVGDSDWLSEQWWNQGQGYRRQFFYGRDAVLLNHVLGYCKRGVDAGEVRVKKSTGALLWWEFQEYRRQQKEAK